MIKDLKKKYPGVEFFEMRNSPRKEFIHLAKFEDFFKLNKRVGYIEEKIDAEAVSEMNLDSLLNAYCEGLPYRYRSEFKDYIYEDVPAKIEKICRGRDCVEFSFYGLDVEVMASSDESCKLDFKKFAEAKKELDAIYDGYRIEKDREEEERNNEISELIESYKERYFNSRTKTEKNSVISQVQVLLREKYGLDGRADYRSSKSYLQMKYEGYILEKTSENFD